MRISRYPPGSAERVVDGLLSEDLIYGDSSSYSSLVSPCSVLLTKSELHSFDRDLTSMWSLYKTWTTLYQCSLSGEAPPWIAALAEQGLSPSQVAVHRMTVEAGMEARLCRLDYVSLGDHRQVAEAQWKSGGPGLFFGISDVCRRLLPGEDFGGEGDAVPKFADFIRSCGQDPDRVTVNVVLPAWLRGEKYLERVLDAEGICYKALSSVDVSRNLIAAPDGFTLHGGEGKRRIHLLSSQGFSHEAPDDLTLALATASVNGGIWVETPLNFIYQQKWGLALPFMEDFGEQFDDHLRKILIPTVLVTSDVFNLGKLTPHLDHHLREILLKPVPVETFVDLPESLRKMIVFKCGAGIGPYYSDSRGVFRVGGSRSTAKRRLDFVVDRIVNHGEPWIAQVYVDQKYSVPICTPSRTEDLTDLMAHGRFMVFGGRAPGGTPAVICALANFGRHWKVTGRSPKKDDFGRIDGSAFADVRGDS